MLATAGFDNTVKLWDFAAGKEIRTLKATPVRSTASPSARTARCWRRRAWTRPSVSGTPPTASSIRELKGHTDIVDSIAFSPDGKLLASGSADKSVRLWNPADGKEMKNLGTHANRVYSVAFSPDGKMLASGGADGVIKLWDVAAKKELKTLKLPKNEKQKPVLPPAPVTGVVFTPNGQQVVSIGMDRFVRLWDVKAGKQVKEMGPTPDDLYGVAFSRDGKSLATSGYAGYITLWDLAGGKEVDATEVESVRRLLHRLHAGRQGRRHRPRRIITATSTRSKRRNRVRQAREQIRAAHERSGVSGCPCDRLLRCAAVRGSDENLCHLQRPPPQPQPTPTTGAGAT